MKIISSKILLVFLLTVPIVGLAQKDLLANSLTIGDSAPPLLISEWIKGKPVTHFENGKIYVVEFWATWCAPCIKAMPLVSKVSRKYRKDVTVLSINAWENKKYPKEKGRAVVDSMGNRVKYAVAFEDSNRMSTMWLDRTWDVAVPISYIINKEGKITWIGHPDALDSVLNLVIRNEWDINAAASKRALQQAISIEDDSAREEIFRFYRNGYYSDFVGEPDSTLTHVAKLVERNPDLQYGYNIIYHSFVALLKTDMKKAFAYAQQVLQPSRNPFGAPYDPIIKGIKYITKYMDVSPELYELGAELMEKYGGTIAANLIKASEWYWLGGNKSAAMRCMKKGRKGMRVATNNNFGTFF